MMYVVKQKCTTWPPIKFGVLVIIINKKVYLHYDNKKEFLIITQGNIRVNNYICSCALLFDNVQNSAILAGLKSIKSSKKL